MQQKEDQPDRGLLEVLAAAHRHHHHHQQHLSIPDRFEPWQYYQWLPSGLHGFQPRSYCGSQKANQSLLCPNSNQHALRRSKKHSPLRPRTSHALCTSFASQLPFRVSRTTLSAFVPGLIAPQRHAGSRTRICLCRAHSARLKSSHTPSPTLPLMQRNSLPPDRSVQDIRAIVSDFVLPHTKISSVRLLPHHRLPRVYEVKLSDETAMLIILPPLPVVRLLRFEQDMIQSEATVIKWLRDELLEPPPLASTDACSERRIKRASVDNPATRTSKNRSSSLSVSIPRGDLIRYLPSPIALFLQAEPPDPADSLNSTAQSSLASFACRSSLSSASSSLLAFNAFQPPPGTPIAALATPLTAAERASVDYQAGRFIRALSTITPKSGKFGPALTVLAPRLLSGAARGSELTVGMTSWSVAFHSILESILRDGEDVAVALAYSTIRKHFRRLGYLLDSVTIPSLVVVDAMDDANLLVQRIPVISQSIESDKKDDSSTASTESPKQKSASPTSSIDQDDPKIAASHSDPSPPQEVQSASLPSVAEPPSNIVVSGLRDWSHCIFGDPLFASVFSEQPSTPFLGGFASANRSDEQTLHNLCSCQDERESRAIRILLYQCYHAVVQVVRGFYRPGRDQSTQELAARKRLTGILAKLEAIDDDPKRRFRHQRPSGEMSPAKKPKSDSEDEALR